MSFAVEMPAKRRLFDAEDDAEANAPGPDVAALTPEKRQRRHHDLSEAEQFHLLSDIRAAKARTPTVRGEIKAICARYHVHPTYPGKLERKLKDPERGGGLKRLGGSGRSTKMTPTKVKAVEKYLEKNLYDASYRELETAMKDVGKSSKGVSAATLQRFAKRRGYRNVNGGFKPVLTAANKQARLDWARTH